MFDPKFKNQVALLLRVLPVISTNESFALHGGTAINLFIRDLPRLSVDIDLTYVLDSSRVTALKEIFESLQSVRSAILKEIPGIQIIGPEDDGIESKLFCRVNNAQVKIEVNTIMRGLIGEAETLPLSPTCTEVFQSFCEVRVVPYAQLYGGKICAALDRQHPRDLFDVYLLMQKGIDLTKVKSGLIYALLSSKRPLHELLAPRFIDQQSAFSNQFRGMSRVPFSYSDFESTRIQLLQVLKFLFTDSDKRFMLSFMNAEPELQTYDFLNLPAMRWKLQNLSLFKKQSPKLFQEQISSLAELFEN